MVLALKINLGTDAYQWYVFAKLVILVGFAIFLAFKSYKIYDYYQKEEISPARGKIISNKIVWLCIGIFFWIVLWLFSFQFYGPGERPKTVPVEETGYYQYIQKAPDMPSQEEIQKKIDAQKPDALKRQDSTHQREIDEANEYIKNAVKFSEENLQ
jgi:hypothetical protein